MRISGLYATVTKERIQVSSKQKHQGTGGVPAPREGALARHAHIIFYVIGVLLMAAGIYLAIALVISLQSSAESYGINIFDALDSVIPSAISTAAPCFGIGVAVTGIGWLHARLTARAR